MREFSTTELSLANHLAHGEKIGAVIYFHCEQCGGSLFHVKGFNEKIGSKHQDIIMERTYYLKCLECGTEEADHILTIIPSWSGYELDRDSLPIWNEDDHN